MITAFLLLLAVVLSVVGAFVNPVEPSRGKLLCLALGCIALAELLRGVGPSLHG